MLSSQVKELSTEVMQLKRINSLLRTESEDLKEEIMELQKKEQQVIKNKCRMYSIAKSIIATV